MDRRSGHNLRHTLLHAIDVPLADDYPHRLTELLDEPNNLTHRPAAGRRYELEAAVAQRLERAPHPTLVSSSHFTVRAPARQTGPDRLAVVFVVDTLGRVEMPSASFVVAPRQSGLRTLVCNQLCGAQYTHPARRTMLMSSWSFDSGAVPSPPATFLVDSLSDRLRAMPRDSAFLEPCHRCRSHARRRIGRRAHC